MDKTKGIFIKDIQEEREITGKFRIIKIYERNGKNGKYLQIEFKDKTGTIIGRKFSIDSSDKNILVGAIYQVSGKYSKQFNSITISNLKQCQNNEYNESDYDNKPENPDKLMESIYGTIENIEDKDIQLILKLFFEDNKFKEEFYNSPAASYYHHNYKHGLLEHTFNVLSICKNISKIYTSLNQDLLYAGAILHDIGKTKVYKLNGLNIEYTEYGKLMEHLYIGAEMVKNKSKTSEPINQTKINKIIHLILSHHGEKKLGYGSVVDPQLPEAIILHYADNLDAKLNQITV